MAPSAAPPGTDHPAPRTTRSTRSATASPAAAQLLATSPSNTAKPLSKSAGKALPKRRLLKENVPPVSATRSAASAKAAPPKATPQATPSKNTKPRRAPAVAETPERRPDEDTPSSSQIRERHSSREKKQTPRAAESWALNKVRAKKEHKGPAAAPAKSNRLRAALQAAQPSSNSKSAPPTKLPSQIDSEDENDNHEDKDEQRTGTGELQVLNEKRKATGAKNTSVSSAEKRSAQIESNSRQDNSPPTRAAAKRVPENNDNKKQRTLRTRLTKEEIKERKKIRIANERYYNGFKPETLSEEEAEEIALEEYDDSKTKRKKMDPFDFFQIDFPVQENDEDDQNNAEWVITPGRKHVKHLPRPEDDETEAILYRLMSPSNHTIHKRKRGAVADGDESEAEELGTDLSPSKHQTNKRRMTQGMQSKRGNAAQGPLNELYNMEDNEPPAVVYPPTQKNFEAHAAMLARKEKPRAVMGMSAEQAERIASWEYLRDFNADPFGPIPNAPNRLTGYDPSLGYDPSRPISNAPNRLTGGRPPNNAVDYENDVDRSNASPSRPLSNATNRLPGQDSNTLPKPVRRSRRSTGANLDAGPSHHHTKSTRSSAEPLLRGAHLDSTGQHLEYEAAPYCIPLENQGILEYPVPYDENIRRTKLWHWLEAIRIALVDEETDTAFLVTGYDSVEIDRAKTVLHDIDSLISPRPSNSLQVQDPLAQRRRKPTPLAKEKEAKTKVETDYQKARILDAREGQDGKTYVMVAWYWTRKEVEKQLKGFGPYLARRWPKEKGWEYMLGATFDVVCSEAIVGIVDADNNPAFSKDMLYGGAAHNFEIWGRDIGKGGYNLDGVELNKEDRDTWKAAEKKSKKLSKEELEEGREKVEKEMRALFDSLLPTEETLAKLRNEVRKTDSEMGLDFVMLRDMMTKLVPVDSEDEEDEEDEEVEEDRDGGDEDQGERDEVDTLLNEGGTQAEFDEFEAEADAHDAARARAGLEAFIASVTHSEDEFDEDAMDVDE